jgi:hypothetical protein
LPGGVKPPGKMKTGQTAAHYGDVGRGLVSLLGV